MIRLLLSPAIIHDRLSIFFPYRGIRQFHHIIEDPLVVIASDVKDIHEPFGLTGDGFVARMARTPIEGPMLSNASRRMIFTGGPDPLRSGTRHLA